MEITTITTNNYNLQFRISQKKGNSTSNRIQTEEHESNVECEDLILSFEEDVFDREIVKMWTVAVIIVLELIFMHNHKIIITSVSGA